MTKRTSQRDEIIERLESALLEQQRIADRLADAMDLHRTAATELEQAVQELHRIRETNP